MITEDYVSFEIAKLLKEKGFDWSCEHKFVDPEDTVHENAFPLFTNCVDKDGFPDTGKNSEFEGYRYSAPTLQMTMKWLREVHKLEISLNHDAIQENHNWWYEIEKYTKGCISILHESGSDYSTYENACEAAIKYCLENLI